MQIKLKSHLDKSKIVNSQFLVTNYRTQILTKNDRSSKIDRKGYLQIDFSVAIFMFFIAFLIFYVMYDSYRGIENNRVDLVELNADARDICSLLISSPGVPQNFESNISTLVAPGFRHISNQSLSTQKINVFNTSNYFTIVDSMGIDSFLYVKVESLDSSTSYLSFGTQAGNTALYTNYVCYSNIGQEIVKVYVELWR